jgi:hypothetical protein
MRAGAIPLLVWALLLGALCAAHWIWTGDTLQVGSFGFAVGLVLACAAITVASDRDTVRRGAPSSEPELRAVTGSSLGAPLTGLAVVACGFGLVFGSFLVFIGVGLFVAGVFVLGRELAGERRARRAWSGEER